MDKEKENPKEPSKSKSRNCDVRDPSKVNQVFCYEVKDEPIESIVIFESVREEEGPFDQEYSSSEEEHNKPHEQESSAEDKHEGSERISVPDEKPKKKIFNPSDKRIWSEDSCVKDIAE